MKTRIHFYRFDLNDPAQREPYHQLCARLKSEPGRGAWMNCISGDRAHRKFVGPRDSEEITLEMGHLFSNQWNSDIGRVFDWYEEIYPNKLIKAGHWLEITDEMREIRRSTLKCGYTGRQFPASSGLKFNESPDALGSTYLKESELHLLRLLPVDQEWKAKREQLTEEERAYLLPKYIAAQTEGADTRAGKEKVELRAKYLAEYKKAERLARMERDGFLWLMDHGIPTENCIFYNHTGRFSFGWRNPFPDVAKPKLLEVLKGFPFEFDVK